MECNKEEAIRAREIAEGRMQIKDFAGAQKLVLKAQRLYPGLENVSQMLSVCEVHISAGVGSEMNWYEILQVPHGADETYVKKQYKKLALVLHPDKNKFPGAEAAFKLIGEANRVLSDQAKRSLYDIKRFHTAASKQHLQVNKSSSSNKQSDLQKKFANQSSSTYSGIPQPYRQQMPTPPTFWTICPFCNTKYQHYRTLLNRNLRCQTCLQTFLAHEISNMASARPNLGHMQYQPSAPEPKNIPFQGVHQSSQRNIPGNSVSGMWSQETKLGGANLSEEAKSGSKLGGRPQKKAFEGCHVAGSMEVKGGAQGGKFSGNAGHKRTKKVAEENRDSTDVEDEKEMESSAFKKKKMETSSASKDSDVDDDITSIPDIEENIDPIDYPDPEFHDFDKDRVPGNFKVDQIWATYDDAGGMPRWYARIRKIYSDGSLRIMWLEAVPKTEDELNWLEAKLPVACGIFKQGYTQDMEDFNMFSHLASWEKGDSRCKYKIYPRKAEVWAIFKDWNVQWSMNPDANRKYEFEFVEILCDYSEGRGVEVARLVMLKGFTSLFQQVEDVEKSPFLIAPNELLRFSHRVPCQRMTGDEREGVPPGSFELDPASVFSDGISPTKEDEKAFDAHVDAEHNAESLKPGNLNTTFVAGSKMVNTDSKWSGETDRTNQNRENMDGFETEDEVCIIASSEKPNGIEKKNPNPKDFQNRSSGNEIDAQCNEHGVRSVANRNQIWNEESLLDRRRSPRKIVSDCDEMLSTTNSTQHPEEERCFPDGKPSNTISSKCHFDRKLNLLSGKVPPNAIEENSFPAPLFYNFESKKFAVQFQQGQVWALYSSVDGGLPKYYARIKKVASADFKVHLVILDACPESEEEIWWSKKELPFGCGKFEVQKEETIVIDEVRTFSHCLGYDFLKGQYLILPRKGEVWAVYKSWNSNWTSEDLKNCEYTVVEILEISDLVIETMALQVVDGFKTVYRGSARMELPPREFLRFSHLVPSFRLTGEDNGKLKGCFELDPLALPDSFLR